MNLNIFIRLHQLLYETAVAWLNSIHWRCINFKAFELLAFIYCICFSELCSSLVSTFLILGDDLCDHWACTLTTRLMSDSIVQTRFIVSYGPSVPSK